MKLAKKFGASVYALAPSGKRGAIVVLSEYRQRHHRKFVAKESGRPYSPPQVVDITGAPGMIRTCDPLIRSQVLYPTELRVRRRNTNSYRRISKTRSCEHARCPLNARNSR